MTEAAIDEFIQLYKEELGTEISGAHARETALRLISLYKNLANRLPSDALRPTPPDDSTGNPMGFRM